MSTKLYPYKIRKHKN